MNTHSTLLSIVFLILWGSLPAQETDTLSTKTITVVKPYTPDVPETFKITADPSPEGVAVPKKQMQYRISSVPVASMYTPAKGWPTRVQKTPPPYLYNSYAAIGLGNYNNALVEAYTSRSTYRGERLWDFALNHYSSSGDIDSTPLEADFYNTRLAASYAQKHRHTDWGADLALQHQSYNWYGIENNAFPAATLAAVDERQHYFNAQVQAYLQPEDPFFTKATLLVRRFWDRVASGENRATFQSTLQLPVTEEPFTLKAHIDVVQGNFENAALDNPVNDAPIAYQQHQVGVQPSLLIEDNALTLHLGASLVYGLDAENNDGSLHLYPAITASYSLLEEDLIAYGGVEGQLQQNSYYDFVQDNPYVSPTLTIQPTDQQYNGYLGIRGRLSSLAEYNLKGVYRAENNKALFLLNPQNLLRSDEKGYFLGNSFQVVYDDVETLGLVGELNITIHPNFTLGLNAELYNYSTKTGDPAWNLPNVQGALSMDYQIDPKWQLGATVFYVGEREDLSTEVVANVPPSAPTPITLESFLDANMHLSYRAKEHLSVFVKANNLANNDYQRWANFRVQGLQILAGASYQFDF